MLHPNQIPPDSEEDEAATRRLDQADTVPPPEFGRYRILRALEQRSSGMVYLAHDTLLARDVLLQVPALLGRDEPTVQRFLRAVRAAAVLSHPNLCPILDAGQHQEIPYLIMPVLEGIPLSAVLAREGPWPPSRAAGLICKLAQAMQAAHQKSVLHRSLNATCVLLTQDGEPIVNDFGQSRQEGSARLTTESLVLGTPGYLAPEVLGGKLDLDGPSRDIYALGVLLYELLTGKLPCGKTMSEVIVQSGRPPQPPSHHRADIPAALDAVCLKTLARNPADRFRSMSDLAVALQDWLGSIVSGVANPEADQHGRLRPVPASEDDEEKATRILPAHAAHLVTSSVSPTETPQRKLERRRRWPLVVATATVLVVALVVFLVSWPGISGWVFPTEATPAERQDLASRDNGADALRREDLPSWLSGKSPPELVAVLGSRPFHLTEDAGCPAFSPDGKRLAVGNGKDILVFELGTGFPQRVLAGHSNQVMNAAFNPAGTLLASGDTRGDVRLWDLVGDQPVRALVGHTDQIETLAFSPDGATLATAGKEKIIRLWRVKDGTNTRTLTGHSSLIYNLAFNTDGKVLASGALSEGIRVWDLVTGKQLWEDNLGGSSGYVRVAFSQDGLRLAAGDGRSTRVWELAGPRALFTAPVSGEGITTFTPDGLTLLTATFRPQTNVGASVARIDATTGKHLGGFTVPGKSAWTRMGVSQDAKTVAVAPISQRTLRVLDVATGKPRIETTGHKTQVLGVAFGPDGKLLASAGHDNTVCVWDLATAKEQFVLRGHTDSVRNVAFHPDGRLLGSGSWDGTVRLWDVVTGEGRGLLTQATKVEKVVFAPDGLLIAVACGDGLTRLWNVARQEQVRLLAGHKGPVLGVAFQGTGKRLATSGQDGTIKLWDVETGNLLHTSSDPDRGEFDEQKAVLDVQTVAGTDRLVSTGNDGTVRIWSWQNGALLHTLRGFDGAGGSVSVRTDGGLLAAGGKDGTVRLWGLVPQPTSSRVIRLFERGDSCRVAALSPEGRYLATANPDGTICILRLASKGSLPQLPE